MEHKQCARCLGDSGTSGRVRFSEMPKVNSRPRYSWHLLPGPALGGHCSLHLALVAQLEKVGHLGGYEVGEEKAEVCVVFGWDGNTALGNIRIQVFEARSHSRHKWEADAPPSPRASLFSRDLRYLVGF